MKELIDAGLVVSIGRVVKIALAFAPKGTRPDCHIHTGLPRKPKWLTES